MRLCVLWLALVGRAAASWTAGLILANGTTFTARDAMLYRSDSLLTVYGAGQVVDLAFDNTLLLAVTRTCVLSIHESLSRVYAGSLIERGHRNGPPLYARFGHLLALAFVSPASVALIDDERLDANVVLMDEWRVQPLVLFPHAFALSSAQGELLVVTPTTAHMVSAYTSVAGSWSAGVLLAPDRALLASPDGEVWQWNIHGLQLQPKSQAAASKLLLVNGVVWGVSFSTQVFFEIERPVRVFAPIDDWSTRPADGECPSGYVLLWSVVCVQASPGGYALDGIFVPCPAGTYNDQPAAASATACKKCLPYMRATPAVCVHCGSQPSNGLACVASCPASVAGLCDAPAMAPTCESDLLVATIARPATTILAAARNGTLYMARGALWSIAYDGLLTSVTLDDVVGCLTITPDETTLYLGGQVLRRMSGSQLTVLSTTMPSESLCASDSAVYLLYQGVVTRLHGDNVTQKWLGVQHMVWDDALVLLAREADQLRIIRDDILLHEFPVPSSYQPWLARWNTQTVMFLGYAVVSWDQELGTMQWIAGAQDEAGYVDDIGEKARFGLILGAQPLGDHALLLWDEQAVRVLFRAGCVCPTDHSLTASKSSCLPCPAMTYAMPGATLCTACPRNSFMDPYGICQPCPLWWWGNAPTPCSRLQNTLLREPHWTFTEIAATDSAVDFVLPVFVIGQPPQRHALLSTDYLGRLWTSTILRPSRPQCVPGIWALCAEPTGNDCECWYTIPLTLKPPWREQNKLYARRGDLLVSLAQDAHMVLLPASTDLFCYIGWPYECSCGDPTLYWSFTSEGCVLCPQGMVVPPNATECAPISSTNPLCLPGEFVSASGCQKCHNTTFSNTKNAATCTPKLVLACEPGYYLVTSSVSDNSCVLCVPCAENEVTFGEPCSGLLTHPSYVCTPWIANIPGFSIVISEWPSLSFVPCSLPLPPHAQWATGPQMGLCYFSCMYSIGDAQEYALDTGSLPWPSTPNLFPLAPSDVEICLPCDTTPCPDHTWRPLWTTECGAPCLLVASRFCPDNTSGCISLCDIPTHAHYTAPEKCEWACDAGWFARNNVCLPCRAASCELDELYDAYKCFSGDPQACSPCPQPALPAIEPGVCRLDCPTGSFQRPYGGPCLPCSRGHFCPPGFRSVCAASPCSPCSLDELPANAVFAPSNDNACRVLCKAGFHTISLATNDIAPYEYAYNASAIECAECGLRSETLFCPMLSCAPGEAIVTVATSEGSGLRCMPCQSHLRVGCQAGTYAMTPCPGGVLTQEHCFICPSLAEHQIYIPYSITTANECPVACESNYVMRSEGCVACSVLYATTPTFRSYFARWDAPPAARWWPVSLDPPHLGLRLPNNEPEPRAGKCWPCGANNDPFCPHERASLSVPVIDHETILVLARHLLSTIVCPPGSYALPAGGCALCPPKRFCLNNKWQRCPRFATSAVGASACHCRVGFHEINGLCVLQEQQFSVDIQAFNCSAHEYRHIMPSGGPICLTCPRGTCPPLCTAMPLWAADCDGACLFGVSHTGQCLPPQCPWLPSEKRCACGPGSEPRGGACLPCSKGTFSAHIGDAPCTPCPPNTTSLAGTSRWVDCFLT